MLVFKLKFFFFFVILSQFEWNMFIKFNHFAQLELRESYVSPCEPYSLGEMARTKMKYEN
jgi:hypothetical protein